MTQKAKLMTAELSKNNGDEQAFTKNLQTLTQSARQYIEEQTKKLTHVHTHLQKLHTSVERLQQQINSMPPKETTSDNNNATIKDTTEDRMQKSIETKATQAMFSSVKKHETPKLAKLDRPVSEALPTVLKNALTSGNFEIQLVKKEIKIIYLSTKPTMDQASVVELEALQGFLAESKKHTLIQNSQIEKNSLIIHAQFSDDAVELQEFLQKNGIISVEPKKSLELNEM